MTEKVIAYITHGARLLVFDHPDHPEAGTQVPGGTVEPAEDLERAVLREAREETGLGDLVVRAYLGSDARHGFTGPDRTPWSVRRHFFHLTAHGTVPERWHHFERHPSDGSPEPILFELYWVDLPDGVPPLSGNQGKRVNRITLRGPDPV